MTSAGSRSGVNWMRLKLRRSPWASVRTASVLARPGTPSSRMWPPVSRPIEEAIEHDALADDDAFHLGVEGAETGAQVAHLAVDLLHVDGHGGAFVVSWGGRDNAVI